MTMTMMKKTVIDSWFSSGLLATFVAVYDPLPHQRTDCPL
jgi:hypothetical protein